MQFKSSKHLFMILLLIILSATFFSQVSAQTFDKKQTALIDKQKSYFDAVIKKNYKFFDENLAEDYIGGYALGVIDKTKELQDLKEFNLTKYQMSDIKTAFPNSQTGIIVFKLHVTVLYQGKDFSEDDILHCIWTLHGKKWLLSSQSAVKFIKNS